jgi:hypothetical protein
VARYKLQPDFLICANRKCKSSTGLHLEPRIRSRIPQCEPKRNDAVFLSPSTTVPFSDRSIQTTFPLCLTFPDDAPPPRIHILIHYFRQTGIGLQIVLLATKRHPHIFCHQHPIGM